MSAVAISRRALALALLCWLSPAPAETARAESHLPVADNLQQAAALAQVAGEPLVLMFSLPDCGYCRVVRRNYLLPLLRDGSLRRPQIRELTMTGRQAIADFDGTPTTPSAVAQRYQVRVAPTLVFVNADGDLLAAPLVGGEHAFYDAMLERAFEASRDQLAREPSKALRR